MQQRYVFPVFSLKYICNLFCLYIFCVVSYWCLKIDQESGFLFSVTFCPSIPGGTFPGYIVSCQRKSGQIENLLRSHMSNKKRQEGKLSGSFKIKCICYQDQDIGDHLKCYVIIRSLATNFQKAWSGYPGKAVSLDVLCFNSGKTLLSGQQMPCMSSQGLVLSLHVSRGSRNLFLGVCPVRLKRVFLF